MAIFFCSSRQTSFLLLFVIAAGFVCSSSAVSWLNGIFGGRNEKRDESSLSNNTNSNSPQTTQSPPALSNFASAVGQIEAEQQRRKEDSKKSSTNNKTNMAPAAAASKSITTSIEHKLLNVPVNNGTGTIFLNIDLQKVMEDPYVHGLVLPAAVGMIVALLTLMLICSIRSCIRSQARKRRKRRIRNLAEELKSDQKVLLTADSDDEI